MDVVMPQLGETVKEGTVTVWHKKVGERVEANEPLFGVNTDKVETEVPAPVSGVLSAILVSEGTTVEVGARLAVIEEAGKPQRPAAGAAAEPPLSPVVRRLLAEHGLDASAIRGSGAGGRITRDDVLAHVEKRKGTAPPNTAAAGGISPPPGGAGISPPGASRGISPPGASRGISPPGGLPGISPPASRPGRVPLSKIRKRTAEQMTLSWRTIPHVLQAIEVDFHAVDRARQARGLTSLPFVAFAVCKALPDFPALNASLDGDALVLHQRVNLGIAVDLGGEGLIVPVVKDAELKSLPDLARDIHSVSERARAGRLSPDDVTEGTYTISNSGKYGTLLTAPIINPPQVAILSTDAVVDKPVASAGGVVIHPVGVLAQSFDHRALDGAYSAGFLRKLKQILEDRDWGADFR
jgi:pyruvate dehydrogenase E2 component (dihydrolipoamide acetyltransferase)